MHKRLSNNSLLATMSNQHVVETLSSHYSWVPQVHHCGFEACGLHEIKAYGATLWFYSAATSSKKKKQ